jgi:hypothetical protein
MRRIAFAFPFLFACSSSSSSSPPADAGPGDAAGEVRVDPVADWSCLGKVSAPTPPRATASWSFGLIDPFTQKPVKGATVKTCAKTDVGCASPFETALSDDEGVARFKVLPTGTTGFDGFFEAQLGAETTNLNYSRALDGDGSSSRYYWGDSALATLFTSSDVKRDSSLATIGMQVHDCKQFPGGVPCTGSGCTSYYPGGVSFTIDSQDPKIVTGYIQGASGGVPGGVVVSPKETSTSPRVGLAGFLNVPPGPVTVTAKVAATGQTIASYPVAARAGAMTLLLVAPQ